MLTKIIIGFLFLLLLVACNQSGSNNDAKKICDTREELSRQFDNITIWSRGDSAFSLNIYNGKKANRYSFRSDNGLKLQSDTVQFQLREVERFKNIDTLNQNNAVKNLLSELLNKMATFKIREVSSDRMSLGISLEFFLRKGGTVFFVRDLSSVTNPIWQNYIKESKKIGEGWYYNKQ